MRKALLAVAMGLSLWATSLVWGPSADAAIIDRIVARVGDQVITHWELEQATTPYLLQRGMSPGALENPERREKIYSKVLDELIARELIQREANKIDLSVSDKRIDRWLQMTRQRQNLSAQQFRTLLSRYGLSYDTYRETVRQNLLKIRLVKVKLGSQINVSQSEVDKQYRQQFGGESAGTKVVDLRHILFEPASDAKEDVAKAREKAQSVLSKLENGKAFETLAEKYGDGPSSKKGGYLGSFQRGELNETFEQVAFELQAGQHSGVVRTKFGFHILRVDDIRRQEDGNAQKRKAQIRQKLRQQKLQEQLDVYLKKLRRDAFVEVKEDAVMLDQ